MKNVLRFAAASSAVLTMIFSPVAMGLQSEDTLKKQIEAFMSQTQLNKRITHKEFWNKTKHLYSGQIYKDVERYFMNSPNELMPEFSLKESLSSTGEKIPTLTISENGKSHTMQIFGEKAKFAKFNNVVLTENDIMLITPAMKRIAASDIKIKKEFDRQIIKASTPKFSGTPTITREMWKKMSPIQRAQFMLNLRFLWSGAQDVLGAQESSNLKNDIKPKGKKTSALDKWNNFFAMINQAEADQAVGTSCVVAGYIGTYARNADKRMSCQYPKTAPITPSCARPCNSVIYGNDSKGNQFCLTNKTELQTATHYDTASNTSCDEKMPLSVLKAAMPKGSDPLSSASYVGAKEKNEAQARAQLDDPKVRDLTQKYLESMLSGDLKAAFQDGKITDAMLAEFIKIQKQFDKEIGDARTACAKAADQKQFDPNFQEACTQLHNRFLFVAEFLSKKPGCPGNKSVNPDTLKCPCDGGGETLPGGQCEAVAAVPVVDEGSSAGGSGVPDPIACAKGTVEKEGSCVCPDGKEPSGSGENKKCGSGFNLKTGLIIGGVAVLAGLLFFLTKKKKKDTPAVVPPVVDPPPQGCQTTCAANTTQNPTTCACDPIVQQPVCSAPQVLEGGVCGCPTSNACTPGQQVYNLSSCQCDTVVQASVCADGVTPYYTPPGPGTCPVPTVCQNGSQVYPPATCPPVTEGGEGDNCPSGDCNGGVPTAN